MSSEIFFLLSYSNKISLQQFLTSHGAKPERCSYLTDILPKKILACEYLKSLEQMQEEDTDI